MVATWGGYNANYVVPGMLLGGPIGAGVGAMIGGNRKKKARERARRWAEIGQWESQHSINPETGALEGPGGAVPGEVALKWQQMHEQAVYNYRQRLMSGAGDYLRGSAGVLQRFRPGGAAALEAGVYGQVGQQQMQQAQMTEPLNLMRDYERQQAEGAAKAAKKAAQMQAISQLAGTLAAVGITAATGGAGAPAAAGMMAASSAGARLAAPQAPGAQIGPDNEIMNPGGGASGVMDGGYSFGADQGGGYQYPAYAAGFQGEGMKQMSPVGGNAMPSYQSQMGGAGPTYMQRSEGGSLQGQPSTGMPAQDMSGGPQAGPQMQQQRQGGGRAGGPGGGQAGQQQMPASPEQQIKAIAQQNYTMGHLADMYTNDPDYRMMRSIIRTEAMMRAYGGAS